MTEILAFQQQGGIAGLGQGRRLGQGHRRQLKNQPTSCFHELFTVTHTQRLWRKLQA